MKRIFLSGALILAVAAVVVGATGAFFSDSETSTANIFTAGAIDLSVGNASWYNGLANTGPGGTSWSLTSNLADGSGPVAGSYLFFNFDDVKPGDWGADTINLQVNDNDAYACATTTLDTSPENLRLETEIDDGDVTDDPNGGELANRINFVWWADDGDSVLETDETVLPGGPLGALGVGGSATVTLADSGSAIFLPGDLSPAGALIGSNDYYVAKGWCFGVLTPDPVLAGSGSSPATDPGFNCDGSLENNVSQTDSLTGTIQFTAEQSRNNGTFTCN